MTENGLKSGGKLESILAAGKFAVTAELGPPKSADTSVIASKAEILADCTDAVNITDNQTAVVRVSSLVASHLTHEAGCEPVMQLTCRDRNRLAMQADILGMNALGIHNLLCLTGDHQSFGNHPQAKGVYDMDAVSLIRMVKDMRDEKKFQCGDEMPVAPAVYIGCAENPFGDPFEFRSLRLRKKIVAGADFVCWHAFGYGGAFLRCEPFGYYHALGDGDAVGFCYTVGVCLACSDCVCDGFSFGCCGCFGGGGVGAGEGVGGSG